MAGLIPFLMQTMAYRRALEEREQKEKEREAKAGAQTFQFPQTDALDDSTRRAIESMNQPYQPSPLAQQLFPDVFNKGKK